MRCECDYGRRWSAMEGFVRAGCRTGIHRGARIYNAAMDKPHASRRHVRRTAWWVAFAALAGFLLADLT